MLTFQAGISGINIQYEEKKMEAKEVWLNVQIWHEFLRQQKRNFKMARRIEVTRDQEEGTIYRLTAQQWE